MIEIHKHWEFKQIKYPYICIRMGKNNLKKPSEIIQNYYF